MTNASSRNMQPKYADSFRQDKTSLHSRNRALRPHVANIPQPRATEIQQSQITLLRSVISANSNNSTELLEQSRNLYHNNKKQNFQNNQLDEGNFSPLQKQSRGGRMSNAEKQNKQKRDVHINAEQNRRTTLKTGFEGLRQIIPGLNDSGK